MSSHSRSAAVLPRVFCLVGPDDDLSLLPALAARGVTGFQVRDKTNEDRDCLALVVTVMASLTSYDVMVVVDDRLDVEVEGTAEEWTARVVTGEPTKEPDEVAVTRFSTGSSFEFEARRSLPIYPV